MKDIPFEKISVEEAKTCTRMERDTPQGFGKNWDAYRGAMAQPRPNIKELLPWVQQLPANVRPRQLVIQYPRIANKLVELWTKPILCDKYFSELMLDQRGTRQGFPPEIALELAALQQHFNTHVLHHHFTVWGDRIGE